MAGLNPNSSPANDYVRDKFLPEVRLRMRARHKQEVFSYGNFRNADPDSLILGWETYDPRPRFGTNWTGSGAACRFSARRIRMSISGPG
jgi:hypothetical protein